MLTLVAGLCQVGCKTKSDSAVKLPADLQSVTDRWKTAERRRITSDEARDLINEWASKSGQLASGYAIRKIEMIEDARAQAELVFSSKSGLRPIYANFDWKDAKWKFDGGRGLNQTEEHFSDMSRIGNTQ